MPWVPVLEAASLCECSERTIRRRVTAGQLAGRTDADGRMLVEVAATHRAPGRQLSEVATALTAQLRLTTDQHAAAMDSLATAGMRTERQLAAVQKTARTYHRVAILASVTLAICLAGAGIGYFVLVDRHRDHMDIVQTHADHAAGLADAREEQIEALDEQVGRLESARDQLTNTLAETATKAAALGAERDALAERMAHTERQLKAIQAATRIGDLAGRAIRRLTERQTATATANGPVSVSSAADRD